MIKEFQLKDAAKLADMFNASDEGWPGGFTHGMPVTPEIVVDWRKKEDALSILVVWDEGKIVGILELIEFWRDTNVLYVGFLNVVPSHHGKGYGKALLKACVKKCTELKCKRFDLHTWAGNMKAVPIYKKTGFFWVPKTTVHMKNFLPLILNMDAAQQYFSSHDWYNTFKREIKVEEDDFDGVYPYRWEEDGDMLSVVIDAESNGVAEFETNEFFISQKTEDAFAGRSVKVTWTIENKLDTPIRVNLLSRGEKGISIDKKESITLEGKSKYETADKAFVDADIEIKKETDPPHLLTTDVVINGIALSLVSGLRVNHAVEISTDPEYLFLPPGENSISVVLENNQKTEAEGVITCQNTGESHPFKATAKCREAVPFTIHVDVDTEDDLQFSLQGDPHIHTIPVQRMRGVGVMQKEKEVILENAHTRIVVSLMGGETLLYDKKNKKIWARQAQDGLGPPFIPSELIKTMYTVKTKQYTGKAIAELSALSKKNETRIIRRIEMDSGPLIKIKHSVVPQKDIKLHFTGESSLDEGVLTLPLAEGIVSEYTMEDVFPLEDGDLPKDPSEFKESWVCYERDGSAFGVIWEQCTEMEVCGYSLLNITMDVTQLKPVYLYLGSGTWKDVRAAWSHLYKKEIEEESPKSIWELNPAAVLTVDDAVTPEFTLESHRNRPFKGTIDSHPFDVKRGTPFAFKTRYDNLRVGVSRCSVHMNTDLFEKRIPVAVVRAGKRGDITISEKEVIEIDNGLYTMKVAPDYYGSVIFFGKDKINHLLTPYPDTTELAWFRPWYGGIHPVVFKDEHHGFPGRMYRETFSYDLIHTEQHDILWEGVKVTSILQEIKGVQVETTYLTTAYSNLLMIEHALVNLSSAPFDLMTGISFFLQPEGSVKDTVLYYYQKDLKQRRRTQYGGWARCKDWAAVQGGDTFLTVVADRTDVVDLGREGAHLFTTHKVRVKPDSKTASHGFFVTADSLDQSEAYRILRRIPWR